MSGLLTFDGPFSETAVERLGWVLVHSLWQFVLVAFIAGAIVRVLRRSSAATRFGVLVVAMTVSVAAPMATWMLQPGDAPADYSESEMPTVPQPQAYTVIIPGADASPIPGFPIVSKDPRLEVPTIDLVATSIASEVRPVERPLSPTANESVTWSERVRAALRPWLVWIVVGWSLGVVLFSARPLLGWRMLWRLRRVGVSEVPGEVLAAMQRVSSQLGLRRAVRVFQSTLAQVPVVVGYLRPVILLPVSLVTSIPPAQLEAILAHELAHVQRHDFVVNLLQTLVETLFFYHPAVWWLSHQIRVEREHCCDDLVVKLLGNRVEYGRALVAIEELRGRSTVLALGAADGSMLSRVRRILGVGPDQITKRSWPAFSLVVCCISVALAMSILTWHGLAEMSPDLSNAPLVADPPDGLIKRQKHPFLNDATPEVKHAVQLPNGAEVELAGVAFAAVDLGNGHERRKVEGWWRADGTKREGQPFNLISQSVHEDHADFREFAIRVSLSQDKLPPGEVHLAWSPKPAQGGGGTTQGDPDDGDATRLQYIADFADKKSVTVQVYYSDRPLIAMWPVDGTTWLAPQDERLMNRLRKFIHIVGVDKGQAETVLKFKSLPNPAEPAEFSIRAVDRKGQPHDASASRNSNEAEGRVFLIPAADIEHFEVSVRPKTQRITFENVSLVPGQITDVKVTVEPVGRLTEGKAGVGKGFGTVHNGNGSVAVGLDQRQEKVVWTHDSQQVFSTGDFSTLVQWRRDESRWVPTALNVDHHGNVIVASLKSPLIVVGTNAGTAEVWNATTLTMECELRSMPDSNTHAVAISPDDTLIAVTGSNGKVHVIDWTKAKNAPPFNGNRVRGEDGHVAILRNEANEHTVGLAFSPDGKSLAALVGSGRLVLWSLPQGERIAEWKVIASSDSSVQWSPDGKQLAVSGWGRVTLVAAEKGSQPRDVHAPEEVLSRYPKADGTIEQNSGPVPGGIKFASVTAIAPDLLTAASVTPNASLAIWELATGKVIRKLPVPDNVMIRDAQSLGLRNVTYSPNGQRLACTTVRGEVLFWHLAQAAEVKPDGVGAAERPSSSEVPYYGGFSPFRLKQSPQAGDGGRTVAFLDPLVSHLPDDVQTKAGRRFNEALQAIAPVTPDRFEAAADRIINDSHDLPAIYRAALMFNLWIVSNEWATNDNFRRAFNIDDMMFERIKNKCVMVALDQAGEIPDGLTLRFLELSTHSLPSLNTDDDPEWSTKRQMKAKLWLTQIAKIRHVIDPLWDSNDNPWLDPNRPPNGDSDEAVGNPQQRADYIARIEAHRRKAERYHQQLNARRLLADLLPRMEEDLIRLYVRKPFNPAQLELLLEQHAADNSQRDRIAKSVRLVNAILPNGTRLKYGWPDALAEAGPAGVPALMAAVRDKAFPHYIRNDGAWALGLIGDPRAIDTLTAVAEDEATPAKYKDIAREFVRALKEKAAALAAETAPPVEGTRPRLTAQLPGGRKIELVGVAHASLVTPSATTRKAEGWWTADGTPLDKQPFTLSPLSVAANRQHFCEFAIRLQTRPKELATPETSLLPPMHGAVWFGSNQGQKLHAESWNPDGFLQYQLLVGFENEKPGTVSFYYSDDLTLEAGIMDLDGKIQLSSDASVQTKKLWSSLEVAGVKKSATETVVNIKTSSAPRRPMQVFVTAIRLDGTTLQPVDPADNERHVFKVPAADLDGFQISLRPMTHRVVCENIALLPGQKSEPTMKVEALPAAAEEPRRAQEPKTLNGLRTRMTLLTQKAAIGLPLRVKIELENVGAVERTYESQRANPNQALRVIGPDGKPVEFINGPSQIQVGSAKIKPGETVTLWDELDVASMFLIAKPGPFLIVLRGVDKFDLDPSTPVHPLPTSNTVEVTVAAGALSEMQATFVRVRNIAPTGWEISTHGSSIVGIPPSFRKGNAQRGVLHLLFLAERKTDEQKRLDAVPHEYLGPSTLGHAYLAVPPETKTEWPKCVELIREQLPPPNQKTGDRRPGEGGTWGQELNGLRTRMISLTTEPAMGKPLNVRIELQNVGAVVRTFPWQGANPDYFLEVVGPDGKPAEFINGGLGIPVRQTKIKPGETVVLWDDLDVASMFLLAKPGRYEIKLRGPDKFNVDEAKPDQSHLYPTSNTLAVILADGTLNDIQATFVRIRTIAPKDWGITTRGHSISNIRKSITRRGEFLLLFAKEPQADDQKLGGTIPYEYLGSTRLGHAYLAVNPQAKTEWPECVEKIREQLPLPNQKPEDLRSDKATGSEDPRRAQADPPQTRTADMSDEGKLYWLRMLNPDGSRAQFDAVVDAQIGLPQSVPQQRWIGLPDRREGLVSLSDLPKRAHWLLAAGDSQHRTLFSVKLPSERSIIEQRLHVATEWTSKNIDLKASVENVGEEGESIVLEIRNQTKETLKMSEADVQLQTSSPRDPHLGGPLHGELMRGLSPRWPTVDREPFTEMTIEPGQTGQLRVRWRDWFTKGLWFSREHEPITEPALPPPEPGKLWVRACLGNVGTLPVSVTTLAEEKGVIKVGMTFDQVIAAKGKHYRPFVGMGEGQLFLHYDDIIVGVENHQDGKGGGRVWRIDPTPRDVDELIGNIPYADAAPRAGRGLPELRTLRKPALLLPDHWIVQAVGFDNDGKELVTASNQSFITIRRWDVVGMKLISEIKLQADKHGRAFREGALMFSGDRRRVVAATDEYVGIWDAATGKLLKQLPFKTKEGIYDCAIDKLDCTPDLSVIVGHRALPGRLTLSYDAHVIVWDGVSGNVLQTVIDKGATDLKAIDLSTDGERLVTTNGSGAKIWETSTGQLLRSIPNDNTRQQDSKPDSALLYTNHVWSLQFSPSGQQLAIGDILGVKLVDATSGKLLQQLEGAYRFSNGSAKLVFSKDGQWLARLGTGTRPNIKDTAYIVPIWSVKTGQKQFELYSNANAGAFSDDNQRFAVGFSDMQQALSVWTLSGDAVNVEQTAGLGPDSRQDKVEENGHYRGQKAAELIDTFKPNWGETKLGIQYGIALTKPQRQFRSGERVPLVVFFRNASDKPLKIDMRPDFFGNTPKVVDAKGLTVGFENVPLLGSIPHYVENLEPGEAVGPFYLNFGLGENPRPGKQNWHPYFKTPVAGQYNLTHSVSINVVGLKEGDESNSDQISSSQIQFEIVED